MRHSNKNMFANYGAGMLGIWGMDTLQIHPLGNEWFSLLNHRLAHCRHRSQPVGSMFSFCMWSQSEERCKILLTSSIVGRYNSLRFLVFIKAEKPKKTLFFGHVRLQESHNESHPLTIFNFRISSSIPLKNSLKASLTRSIFLDEEDAPRKCTVEVSPNLVNNARWNILFLVRREIIWSHLLCIFAHFFDLSNSFNLRNSKTSSGTFKLWGDISPSSKTNPYLSDLGLSFNFTDLILSLMSFLDIDGSPCTNARAIHLDLSPPGWNASKKDPRSKFASNRLSRKQGFT